MVRRTALAAVLTASSGDSRCSAIAPADTSARTATTAAAGRRSRGRRRAGSRRATTRRGGAGSEGSRISSVPALGRVPPVIAAAITSKAQAIQDAERARNELAKTQAEAAKTIAAADGEAKAAVTRANGEAEANKIRQTSLTPQLLELRKLIQDQTRGPDQQQAAIKAADSILAEMKGILEKMLELEDYNALLSKLRKLIDEENTIGEGIKKLQKQKLLED